MYSDYIVVYTNNKESNNIITIELQQKKIPALLVIKCSVNYTVCGACYMVAALRGVFLDRNLIIDLFRLPKPELIQN